MTSNQNADDNGDDLICPITLQVFRDPVIAADGHVYEREAITQWIREHGTSPLTRQPLTLHDLKPDYVKKRLADQRRNSRVSFHAETNTVTLPPLRVGRIRRTQVSPEEQTAETAPTTDSDTNETHEQLFYIRTVKYLLGVLCLCVYLIVPSVSVYLMMKED